jgi:hypothetical protein
VVECCERRRSTRVFVESMGAMGKGDVRVVGEDGGAGTVITSRSDNWTTDSSACIFFQNVVNKVC